MKPALLLLACLSLSGCGLSGDLYLPDEPAAPVEQTTTAPATPPADVTEDDAARKKK